MTALKDLAIGLLKLPLIPLLLALVWLGGILGLGGDDRLSNWVHRQLDRLLG